MKPRHALLAAALAATVAAAWLGRDDAAEVVEARPRALSTAPRAPAPAAAPVGALEAGGSEVAVTPARFVSSGPNLFPAQSWKPPPPPPPIVIAPPPPPPQAPPLPFKYIGRWDAGEGEAFFLAQGEQVASLRVGQKLAQWQLDSVDAGGLNFTYLPLQQQRQLRFGP